MDKNRPHYILFLALTLLPTLAHAGDWDHMKQACKNAWNGPTRFTVEDCAIKFYGLEPVGPQIGSIAPQGGRV